MPWYVWFTILAICLFLILLPSGLLHKKKEGFKNKKNELLSLLFIFIGIAIAVLVIYLFI